VFYGRDKELIELVGRDKGPQDTADPKVDGRYDPAVQSVSNIRACIEGGKGIGRDAILAINDARGVKAQRDMIDTALKVLKSGGVHDTIIKEVAAEAKAHIEAESEVRKKRAAYEAAQKSTLEAS